MSAASKVDLHTHLLPETWPDWASRFGSSEFPSLEHHADCRARILKGGKVFREIESNCWDAKRRLSECDAAGVSLQVLSTVPLMFHYGAASEQASEIARFLNDHLAGVVAGHPDRFAGLGTLPMQDPQAAIRELERCVKELGLPGVQIGSHVGSWGLDAPELFPIFEAASSLGACVFVHPWDMPSSEHLSKYWQRWLVGMPMETAAAICQVLMGGVLDRLPKLRIAFAHGGGSFAGTLGRIDHGFRARPDLCATETKKAPSEFLGKFYVDSLVHDVRSLELIVERFGAERVALGTDYPFPLGEENPGALIESSSFSEDAKARLLSGTALEFLGR